MFVMEAANFGCLAGHDLGFAIQKLFRSSWRVLEDLVVVAFLLLQLCLGECTQTCAAKIPENSCRSQWGFSDCGSRAGASKVMRQPNP